MPNFIDYDYSQNTMVVINFENQLQSGAFEYALHFQIEKKLDLKIFHQDYKNEKMVDPHTIQPFS